MKGSILARRSGGVARESMNARMRQKRSSPSSISCVRNGAQRLDDGAGGGEVARRMLDRRARPRARRGQPQPASEQQPDAQALQLRGRVAPVEALRRQAHVVARVGLRRASPSSAPRRRRCASSARRRGRYRADRSARARGSASSRRCRTSRPAAAPSRRCRCRYAAGRSQRPRRRRRRADEPPGLRVKSQGLRVSGWKLDRPDDSMP